jgi:hypothetical protein
VYVIVLVVLAWPLVRRFTRTRQPVG